MENNSEYINIRDKVEMLDKNLVAVKSNQNNVIADQKWVIKFATVSAIALVSVLGYLFVTLTNIQAKHSAVRQHLMDLDQDFTYHREHPNFHANGFQRTAKLLTELEREIISNRVSKGELERAEERIENLEQLMKEILEGYIEKANLGDKADINHDQ